MKLFAYLIFFLVLHTAKLSDTELIFTLWLVNILNFDLNKFHNFTFVAIFENQNKKMKLTK